MKWIEKYLVETNIWVAFCFTALVVFFQINLYEINYSLWGIAFFGTLAVYNFTRIGSFKKIQLNSYRIQLILTLIGLIGTFICIVIRNFELKEFLYLGVLGLVSFCYSLPFSGLGLRWIPFIKLLLISFVWTASSIGLLTVVHEDFSNNIPVIISVFCFIMGITIPFDIRDSQTDELQLQTIPQMVGIQISQLHSVLFLLLSGVFILIRFPLHSFMGLSWTITCLISIVFCCFATPDRNKLYFSFWMESLSILPLLLYYIIRLFP